MKIAICFSGMIRTGVYAVENIKGFLGDHYSQCDFFIHTWDISEPKCWHFDSVGSRLHGQNIPKVTDGYKLCDELVRCYDGKFKGIKVNSLSSWRDTTMGDYTNNISPLWYSWQESVKLKQQYEESKNFNYSLVLKLRPDILFEPNRRIETEINHYLKNPKIFYANGFAPVRIDDVFFYSHSKIMDTASQFFQYMKYKSWNTNAFGEYLKSMKIDCDNTAELMYTILREEALIHDVKNFNLCFNIDRDYYAPYNTDRLPV